MADGPQLVIYLSFMLSLAATSAQFVDMSSRRHTSPLIQSKKFMQQLTA